MNSKKRNWMTELREIRDWQAEQMKDKSTEEQLRFVREKAEKLHRSAQEIKS
jgi:hypothetical protein